MNFGNLINLFWPSTVSGLTLGAIYALIALGYTLVYGVLRLINFAHSEIFMLGTFGALIGVRLAGLLGIAPTNLGTSLLLLVVALIFGMAVSGLCAVVLELVAYRPLRKRGASRLAALISAIGASLFLSELVGQRWAAGRELVPFPRIIPKTPLFKIFSAQIGADVIIVFVAAITMMVALDRFVNGTRLGRGIRAVAQDAESATLMGIDINKVVMVTFLLGGLMAGAAAALYDLRYENTKFNQGFILGIKAFTAAVLGGIGNLRGALLGGFALGLVENYGSQLFGNHWTDVIAFVALVLVLMFRPTGLLGESLAKARA